jgi:UDP-glucose:(heptosyl)LPS alpha-1,3-glucosyltransferase
VRGKDFDVIVSQGPNCLAQTAMLMHFCSAACRDRMRTVSPRSLAPSLGHRAAKSVWHAYCVAIEKWLCRKLRGRVIAVSEGLARDLEGAYGLTEGDVRVVPNGVDAEEFRPENKATLGRAFREEHAIPHSGFVAAFVGGDWALKGLDHAIRALELVGDRDIHLVVAGDGDREAFGELVGPTARQRLHFVGWLRSSHAVYAAADVFVFPSYFESFPLVVLEAAAAGLPLLAPRLNGVEDTLVDGDNGLVIRRQPEDVGAKLCRLHDDRALRGRMSRAARKAISTYSWEAAAERLDRCLRRIRDAEAAPC